MIREVSEWLRIENDALRSAEAPLSVSKSERAARSGLITQSMPEARVIELIPTRNRTVVRRKEFLSSSVFSWARHQALLIKRFLVRLRRPVARVNQTIPA
jgi:hypothetical protein